MPYMEQPTAVEIGSTLGKMRERAKIRQTDLAARLGQGLSAAVLSRIESGERATTSDEIGRIVEAIGTTEALALPTAISRAWTVMNRPELDHPDQELLWEADRTAARLQTFLESEVELREAFRRRIVTYIEVLTRASVNVMHREYQIVLVGKVGIGKSTALCRLTGLELPSDNGVPPSPVFATGTGRITICEVHLKRGQGYAISIVPADFDDIRAYAYEFAEQFVSVEVPKSKTQDESEQFTGISAEMNRAIRNMTGLTSIKKVGADGKTIRFDRAKDLASSKPDKRDFVLEVLSRMDLPRRDRREIRYQTGMSKSPLQWLQQTFAEINSGRHSEFTIPQRIEVTVKHELLPNEDLSIKFVDTQGVDEVAARPDLERFFGISHTLMEFCSGFNDAPSETANVLLGRAKASGTRDLYLNTAILVLPHPNQAVEIRDDSGVNAETDEEGYDLKRSEVEASLRKQNLGNIDIGFFNARADETSRAHTFLNGSLERLRTSYRSSLKDAIRDSVALLDNHGKAQVESVLNDAAQELSRVMDGISGIDQLAGHIEDSVIEQFARGVHHSTVKATVRRSGEWYNFNYGHHLSTGARQMTVRTLVKKLDDFSHATEFMLKSPNYIEAQGLLNQAKQVLNDGCDTLLRKTELLGESFFKDELKKDSDFWKEAAEQWGSGYRDDVQRVNRSWFSEPSHRAIEKALLSLINVEWEETLNKVRSILPTE
jgi:transcriptional regulator with XRE-family HTH domain